MFEPISYDPGCASMQYYVLTAAVRCSYSSPMVAVIALPFQSEREIDRSQGMLSYKWEPGRVSSSISMTIGFKGGKA